MDIILNDYRTSGLHASATLLGGTCAQEAKSELGMSDYQVRKWIAWHHHMALVMLSLSFIVKERMTCKVENPLLSSWILAL